MSNYVLSFLKQNLHSLTFFLKPSIVNILLNLCSQNAIVWPHEDCYYCDFCVFSESNRPLFVSLFPTQPDWSSELFFPQAVSVWFQLKTKQNKNRATLDI